MNSHFLRPASLLAATLLGFCLSSCTQLNKGSPQYSTTFDPPAHRPHDPSAVKVKISTGAQRLYVTEGDRVLLATPCSVGTSATPTPPGPYRIYYKEAKKRRASSPGAGYPMAYWMEFKPAYGIHWGYVKPYPCTHGCVRLPMKSAAKAFAMVKEGTPVYIASSHPEDSTVGASLPRLDDTTLPDPPNSYLLSDKFFHDATYKGSIFVD